MFSLANIMSSPGGMSADMFTHSAYTCIALLAEFVFFASWKQLIALPRPLVLPVTNYRSC